MDIPTLSSFHYCDLFIDDGLGPNIMTVDIDEEDTRLHRNRGVGAGRCLRFAAGLAASRAMQIDLTYNQGTAILKQSMSL